MVKQRRLLTLRDALAHSAASERASPGGLAAGYRRGTERRKKCLTELYWLLNLVQHGVNKHTISNGAKARNTILLTFDF